MPNTCKTCQREDVNQINKLLVGDTPLRNIVVQYAGANIGSLKRHKDKCLKELLVEARAEKRIGLLADVDDVRTQIVALEKRFADNGPVMVALVSRRLEAVDKEAKLTGAYIDAKKNPADLAQYIKVLKDWGIDKTPDELRAKAEQIEAANQIPAGMLVEKVIQVEGVQ